MGKLGTEITSAFVAAGARVAVFDLVSTPNDTLRALAEKGSVRFYAVDVTDETQVEQAVENVAKDWGVPTILVNNAGWRASPNVPSPAGVPFERYPMEMWDEAFKVNARSAAVCSKVVGRRLIDGHLPGVMINVPSVYAMVSPDQRVYAYKEP